MASGTLGLVNDLSVKLQKQRKQLNALVKEVKASQAKELRWFDYAGVMFLNNVAVIVLGFMLSSAMLGVGPADGSFTASRITTTGLTVSGASGMQQEVEVMSSLSNSTVAVQSSVESTVLFAGQEAGAVPQFEWAVARSDTLTLTQAKRDTADLEIRPAVAGQANRTDVCLSPGGGGGTVVVAANLELTGTSIRSRNGSLTLRPGLDMDLFLQPSAGGRVDVKAPVDLAERLKVSLGSGVIQFDANPRANMLAMGVDEDSRLTMHGTANLSSSCTASQISGGMESHSVRPCHVIDGGDLIISKGNMILGNANINSEGSLSVAGDVNFGSSANDTLQIQGALSVTNGTMDNVQFHPLTGSVESAGFLVVERMADLRSSVVMGSDLSDTVSISAALTTLNNLNASGSARLGELDSHSVQLYGDLLVMANASAHLPPVLSVNGTTGDVFSDCDMYVTRGVRLDDSVTIGTPAAPGEPLTASNDTHMLTVATTVEVVHHSSTQYNQTLTVDGASRLSDMFAEECVLRGSLGVGEHAEDFTVDNSNGNVFVRGVTTIGRSARFDSNVSLGQGKRHQTTVGGDAKLRSTLHALSKVSVGSGLSVDGELEVGGDLFVEHDHSVTGDVYLGVDAGQRSTVHGRLHVSLADAAAAVVLDIDPSGDISIDGRFTVQGETELDGTTNINASAVVNGGALLEGLLRVETDVVVADGAHVGERIAVDEAMLVQGNLTVNGPSILGSGPEQDIEIAGSLFVAAEDSPDDPLLTVSADGVLVTDTLLVQDSVLFLDKLDLGAPAHGPITVLASTVAESPIEALDTVVINGHMSIRDAVSLDAGLLVQGDTALGRRETGSSNVISVLGDVVLKDGDDTRVQVSHDSGDIEMWSDLQVQGNLGLGETGTIETSRFVVGNLQVEDIRERTPDQGVNVEGVVFSDGGVKLAQVHEMRELLSTKGVTVEGANCKAGALVLRAGGGTDDIVALTLTNHNHQDGNFKMAGTSTRLAWQQYFHDSRDGTEVDSQLVYHSEAGAASVSVLAVEDWTDDPLTQEAKISFETAWKGVVAERAKIEPAGGFVVLGGSSDGSAGTEERLRLDSAEGHAQVSGDLHIGAGKYTCALPSNGETGGPQERDPFGQCSVCSECCLDLTQEDCDLCVAKKCAVTYGARSLDITSEAEQSSLILESGGTGSTTITMVSGPAAVAAEDPRPASFSLINTAETDDAAAVDPFLRLVDSREEQSTDLLVLTARPSGTSGRVGDVYVAGSLYVGEVNTTLVQRMEQSVGLGGGSVTLSAQSKGSFDASIVITSGPNQESQLRLQDPADGASGSGFLILNAGAQGSAPPDPDAELWTLTRTDDTGYPTLRVSNDNFASMMSVYDLGDTGSLMLDGDLSIAATITVIAGSSADATVQVQAGDNQRAAVLLSSPDGQFYSISPDTVEAKRLMFGYGVDEESEKFMMNVAAVDGVGVLYVSGSGIFGDLETSGERSLGVVSGAQAELKITAGEGAFGASTVLTSGPDKHASLVLSVQSAADAVGTDDELFPLTFVNNGEAEMPALELHHREHKLLAITDWGERADLSVSGNCLLGNRAASSARSLKIESADSAARLVVVSGMDSDALLTIRSGAGREARLMLEDTGETEDGTFIFKNSGAEHALLVLDAAERLLMAVHDRGASGDLEATGDANFGSSTSPGSRSLTIAAGKRAKLDVTAGINSDASISMLSGGPGTTASLEMRSPNSTGFLLYTGASHSSNALQVAVRAPGDLYTATPIGEGLQDIISVIDRGPTGDLAVTGDVVVGAIHGKESFAGDKLLKVESHGKSTVGVHSGDFDDAYIQLLSGPQQTSKVTLEQIEGALFEVQLSHDQDEQLLEITNGADQMIVVDDRGTTGDVFITGNGVFGRAPDSVDSLGPLDNSLLLTGARASLDIIAGPDDPANLVVTSGADEVASLRLATHDTSYFELRNIGTGYRRLELFNMDTNEGDTASQSLLQLTDLGDRSQLAFVGDVDIGTANSTADIQLNVESALTSQVGIQAGWTSDAMLELTSGINRVSQMSLISKSNGGAASSDVRFDMILDGGEAGNPSLTWRDGPISVVTIVDMGITGDMQAVAVSCARYTTTGDVTFGDSSQDSVSIEGHIVNDELHFDGDHNGIDLVLRFEDPADTAKITFPDESGTVLTSASSYSTLAAVGELSSGAISEGFGVISTDSSIETIGSTSSISAAGTVTSHSNFLANGNIQLGDESTDAVSFRGVVQQSFRFGADRGVQFHGPSGGAPTGKTTWLKAEFDATSELGLRQIVIPDVSVGGALHVVSNTGDANQISNVNQVSMDTTAGKVIAPADLVLLPMDVVTFHVVNKRVTTDSIVMAMICDDQNTGSWIMVTGVKVNVGGGGFAVVIHNVHPTTSAEAGFSIYFAVFNSS